MNNGTENSIYVDRITVIETYFYLSCGVLGALFNLIVLFIGFRHVDTSDKPRQIIVINMTLADLITCLIYISTRPILSKASENMCYPYYVLIFVSQFCSCLNLLWLNVDKFIYIKHPLNYYLIVTRKRVLIVCWLTWISLTFLGALTYSTMKIVHPCNAVKISDYIYLCIVIMYVVIISGSFIISAIIYFIATNSRRMEPSARSQLFKRLFFVFSSTFWTFITCIPYRLLYLTYFLLNDFLSQDFSPFFYQLTDFFLYFIVVGILMNPLITILTQRLYREKLFYYFKSIQNIFPCWKEDNEFSDRRTVIYSEPKRLLSLDNRKRFNSCIEVPVTSGGKISRYETLRIHRGTFNGNTTIHEI
ncbi:G protein-coupled receptor, rhodopsin-like family and GPCR, rhodopsin-like, 7TM domain-containing protein [Strongyloides ratti]|uniref:G protein-coupled receptor, rhodopsin-like family and GPCR, rhodopsin-like, 7TM domain-containing protein n=1 Tax=Strongyloides ratti TaxID=34506 RepID=A0A090LT03_STRRB|nr:G protein-coupled receptor, rhodopsin-like family and GPCR, rhodopsin-like, 7TM domain-containing protein [Strongyloides ratti]CEF70704.1 G protein-coupled receptor, rhodopsin-like family and GPCR, rhodopsin-like, 7TM domain-containing protein [Strongyloides ratti]